MDLTYKARLIMSQWVQIVQYKPCFLCVVYVLKTNNKIGLFCR